MEGALDKYFMEFWRSVVEERRLNDAGAYHFSMEGAYFVRVQINSQSANGYQVRYTFSNQDTGTLFDAPGEANVSKEWSAQPYIPFQGDLMVQLPDDIAADDNAECIVTFIRIQARQERVKVAGL